MTAALLVLTLLQAPAAPNRPAAEDSPAQAAPASTVLTEAELDARTADVASRLRCPVCQQLSILDSPAELAQEMKAVVRERLAGGQSPEEVTAYFVSKYGEWILLDPPKRGFNLVVWLMPVATLGGGVVLLVFAFRRWLGAPRGGSEESPVSRAP